MFKVNNKDGMTPPSFIIYDKISDSFISGKRGVFLQYGYNEINPSLTV